MVTIFLNVFFNIYFLSQFYIAMISGHAMFLAVNQFALCIKNEWKQCSFFSPPATVILLLFLTFEALLFAVFTLIMLGTQINAIWNDETVSTFFFLFHLYSCSTWLTEFRFNFTGYRAIEEGGSQLGEKITLEEYPIGFRAIFDSMVFAIHKASH